MEKNAGYFCFIKIPPVLSFRMYMQNKTQFLKD